MSKPCKCSPPTSPKSELDRLEETVAACRARKAQGKGSMIACLSEKLTGRTTAASLTATIRQSTASLQARGAALDAAVARLAAVRAQGVATVAKEKARVAAALATSSKTPHLDAFMALKGAAATTYFRQHETAIKSEQRKVSK
jgi:hypothetical protein